MPVVMISTLTEKGSEVTLRALELGAVDYISKPKLDITRGIQEYAQEITDKIRIAAAARIRKLPPSGAPAVKASLPALGIGSTEKVIVIGASTGGTEAIKEFLVQLPPDSPGIVITQHMPESFTRSFAERLDRVCPKLSVREASDGDRVLPGHVYVAPGHSHMLLVKEGANYVTRLNQEPPVNRHRPSVDVLFSSAARSVGRNTVGVILTGMGKDGAVGMAEMKQAGAYNFAQDEASCVVFGMPKEAIAHGGVDEVAPLAELPGLVLKHLKAQGHGTLRV
jgi:two-component system chemotaxis response regulator CheB